MRSYLDVIQADQDKINQYLDTLKTKYPESEWELRIVAPREDMHRLLRGHEEREYIIENVPDFPLAALYLRKAVSE